MKYQSYLVNEDGSKLTRHQRHGAQGRARMNEVYEYNKKLHSKRHKRQLKLKEDN